MAAESVSRFFSHHMCQCPCSNTCSCLLSVPGVIGRRLKMENFIPAIPQLLPSLGSSVEDAHRAAVAITTTGESRGAAPWA